MSRANGADYRWAEHHVEVGHSICCEVGPLHVWALRHEQEWRIGTVTDAVEPEDLDNAEWEVTASVAAPEGLTDTERYVFRSADARVRFTAGLADRPIVSSPRIPLFVPPAEATTLFVGSPLWLRVEVAEPPTILKEIPVRRPSDTWFGSPTGDGELCYSTRTRAALSITNVPITMAWAVTPVIIRNGATTPLSVDRLKLPVPFLPVYVTADRLWTPAVTMEHREGNEMAVFDVHRGPPPEAEGARLLTAAREVPAAGLLIRAFGGLFTTW
jgi:hypothetical protein